MSSLVCAAIAMVSLTVALVGTGFARATSPGGNGLIAFASDRAPLLQHPQVFSLSARGGQPRNLSRAGSDDSDPAPSPDGRQIAFARGADIWLMNADGSRQRQLVRGGHHPVWSPNGKAIAYDGGGPGDCPPPSLRCGHTVAVWTVRLDGSPPRLLQASSRNPSWSPDGRRLAYEGGIDPYGLPHGIRVANADGGNARWLSRTGGEPAWSPNGRLIAYHAGRRIVVARADGTGLRRIAAGLFPSWAPRGNRLAYACGDVKNVGSTATSAFCVINADGGGRRVVARGVLVDGLRPAAAWSPRAPRLSYAHPQGIFTVGVDGHGRKRIARRVTGISITSLCWSADGRRLVFGETMDTNDLEIYTVEPNGSRLRSLTRNDVDELEPSWSPDGRELAFVRLSKDRPVIPEIWAMNADGSGQRLIRRNGVEPSWSADGRTLVFTRYGVERSSTYAVPITGGREELLVSGGIHAVPSPDGTRLAFVRGSIPDYDVFVAAADGSGEESLAAGNGPLSWSPDSKTLLFTGCTPGYLCTVRVDGGLAPIPVGEPSPHSSSFSPDGTAVTFSSGTQYPRSQIEVSAADGSGRRAVTAARGRNQDPAWQPLPNNRGAPPARRSFSSSG